MDELCYCYRCSGKFPSSEMEMINGKDLCPSCNPTTDTFKLARHALESKPRVLPEFSAIKQVWEALWEAGRESRNYTLLNVNHFG